MNHHIASTDGPAMVAVRYTHIMRRGTIERSIIAYTTLAGDLYYDLSDFSALVRRFGISWDDEVLLRMNTTISMFLIITLITVA